MKKFLITLACLVIASFYLYVGLLPHKQTIQDAIMQYTYTVVPIMPITETKAVQVKESIKEESIKAPTHVLTSRPGGTTQWYCAVEASPKINNEAKDLSQLLDDYNDCMDDKTPDDVKKYMSCINDKECQHDNDCQEDCFNKYGSELTGFKSQDAQKECLEDYDYFDEVKSFYQRWSNSCYVSY